MDKIVHLLKQDPMRVEALHCVKRLELPQCYIAAGFLRNLVWDALHNKTKPTPLNDIDVVYFDDDEMDPNACFKHEAWLNTQMPQFDWQVRNQALMHHRNNDQPYKSTLDAMSYWPEKETAVGVRVTANSDYECVSAFGFESLFNGHISYNRKRPRSLFEQRVYAKNWLVLWPSLKVVYGNAKESQDV
ncbi:nucleotidyltransferase family protein [Vibrio pelagius]|uniref:nucleotidyltransferase family protein n=1 Tax=Vibrio pelagius TaxID=28169 RepID=UPI0021C38D7F|nr:nucleotidyltransferase family protein [Vibrio pelagius]